MKGHIETTDSNLSVNYTYDALGRRVQRTEASDTTNIHFSAKTDLPDYWSDATGNITAALVRGPDGLTTFTLDPTSTSPYPCYHLFSPHGDTTMITDAQGASIATSRYDSFGNTTAGVTGLWYGYTGKYERYSDGATGTIEMGVREYDPGLGRFTSVDPLKGTPTDPQQRNRYTFTSNNPMVRYDLNGMWWGGDAWGWVEDQFSDAASDPYNTGEEIVDFLVIDDVRTAFDKEADFLKERIPAAVFVGLMAEGPGIKAGGKAAWEKCTAKLFAKGAERRFLEDGGLGAIRSIGIKGSRDHIRMMKGNVDDARTLFNEAIEESGAINVRPHPNVEGGLLADVPGGGTIGFRPTSSSGPPTVDFNKIPSFPNKIEVKFQN